ncbi:MAG: PGPGW domain-containing protein, partial [Chthoniobacterales bacterium]
MEVEGSTRHRYEQRKRAWQQRLNEKLGLDRMPVIRKLVYSVLGLTVLLIGIAMIVLPGPAVIVIPIGLAILASEYAWARRIIRRGRVFV